ncbi:MAG: M23 family metallopeptidase [bacterium]|nr:M23 family metallopeptidase [bacterium]
MGIPSHTRIILMTGDRVQSREYGITRAMVIALLLLVIGATVLMALLMHSFAGKHNERSQIKSLEKELSEARVAVQGVGQLREELLFMQGFQEKLLYMLGVQEAPHVNPDSLSAWLASDPTSAAEALGRSATLTMSPAPKNWPLVGFISREFEKGAVNRGIKPHRGIDIDGEADSPVVAAGVGRVVRTGHDKFLGNYVEIQHGLGYLTVYGHCSRIAVNSNDRVDAGQVIAYVGQSGQASAPHLHFEIYVQGEAVDPRQILEGDPPTN